MYPPVSSQFTCVYISTCDRIKLITLHTFCICIYLTFPVSNIRLFDSQNNNRGSYNVGGDGGNVPGSMTYIGGSLLHIGWTNQHQCGGDNAHCDIILQYMCDSNVRDGTTTQLIYLPIVCNLCKAIRKDSTHSIYHYLYL